MKSFASDNYAGAHPDVLAALTAANGDHAVSYGADPWTARAEAVLAQQQPAQAPGRQQDPQGDGIEELTRLAELHRNGDLTDADDRDDAAEDQEL